MADKSVGELIAAQSVTPTDLFVLEQNGTAKKLTGQILENWLVSFADGHGGIQSIVKESTSGLVDTYRITLADTTTFDFMVTNGKGINSVSKVGTNGLVDTYRIAFNDGTTSTFAVTNGAKGDKGDNTYLWIKYASQEPTAASHSFGDVPDNWIGVYSGSASTAPTDWTQYKWFKIKGETGNTGAPATLISSAVEYLVSDSGTVIPSGSWVTSIPSVAQGKFLWTRVTQNFNTGSPVVFYAVSRMGLDGLGSVRTICGISPDDDGNVPLTAAHVGARPSVFTYESQNGGDLNTFLNETHLLVFNVTNKPFAYNYGWFDVWRASASGFSPSGAKPLIIQRFIDWDSFGVTWRYSIDGGTTFSEWQYENPPLVAGVEYPTTKRFGDAVVYTKRINFGALPNAAAAEVEHGVTATRFTAVKCVVYRSNGEAFEVPFANDGTKCQLTADGTIKITTDWNAAAYPANVILEYTK